MIRSMSCRCSFGSYRFVSGRFHISSYRFVSSRFVSFSFALHLSYLKRATEPGGPSRHQYGASASHEPENRSPHYQPLADCRFMAAEQLKKELVALKERVDAADRPSLAPPASSEPLRPPPPTADLGRIGPGRRTSQTSFGRSQTAVFISRAVRPTLQESPSLSANSEGEGQK
jgi:hypothetical protein